MPLGKRSDFGDARYAGVEVNYAHDIAGTMQEYLLCGFDFVLAPLVQPGHEQPALQLPQDGSAVTPVIREELMLTSATWGGQIVGKVSSWIDPDSPEPELAQRSAAALQQELSWAAFLGLQAVLLPTPQQQHKGAFNHAQVVNQALGGLSHMALWLQLPMTEPPAAQQQQQQDAPAAAGGDVLPFAVNDPGESHVLRPYWEYLCYLFRRLDGGAAQEQVEAGYRDYLQAPLQPLQDNLESQTYETFEKDVTKYACYQAAVHAALLDRVPDDKAEEIVTTLMVVGAGRGPLVRSSIAAARATRRKLRVYAVEKNPAAIVHIQRMVRCEGWQEMVTIVHTDMREWQPPELADILVSELLGSFGDNELSPECLDGAQRLLKPGGISIPASYTSFLAPVTTAKLWDAVRNYKDLEHCETPYVVKFHRHYTLSPPQPVFTFVHPNPQQPPDNNRAATLRFPRPAEEGVGVLHGFAGYFESVLYKDVTLNTHPPTHTPNMFSWFPIFFPLREPLTLPAGADVITHMWRKCGKHKVWYEWAVSEPVACPIHNPGGRSYYVGL